FPLTVRRRRAILTLVAQRPISSLRKHPPFDHLAGTPFDKSSPPRLLVRCFGGGSCGPPLPVFFLLPLGPDVTCHLPSRVLPCPVLPTALRDDSLQLLHNGFGHQLPGVHPPLYFCEAFHRGPSTPPDHRPLEI